MKGAVRKLCLSALLVLLSGSTAKAADAYNQDFSSWTASSPGVHTNAGWVLYNGFVLTGRGLLNASSGAYLSSPLLTNSAGTITWTASSQAGATAAPIYELQKSLDKTSWTPIRGFTNTTVTPASTTNVITVTEYSPCHLRLYRTNASRFLYLDNVTITVPPSAVTFTDVVTTPSTPSTTNTVEVSATITPRAGANNVTPALFYRTLSGSAFTQVNMASTGGFNYETAGTGIPALSPTAAAVEYYIRVVFQGSSGVMTNYYPSGAPSNVQRYTVRARSPFGSMRVTGSATTNLLLVSDNEWQGVIVPSGTLSNPTFYFNTGTTNWGDFDQAVSNRPVFGRAELGAPAFKVSGSVTNPLAFLFRDFAPMDYSVQNAKYVNFESGWPKEGVYGSYTNNQGWIVQGAAITNDAIARRFIGKSALLKHGLAGGNQFLRSPRMDEGVGAVSFWYRHRNDPGSPSGAFRVQKSTDGSTWTDVGTAVTNIQVLGYIRHSASLGDLNTRYVRILNNNPPSRTNSWLCLDEVIVTAPGAAVQLGNPARVPAAPALGQTVSASVDAVTISGGAINLAGTVFFKHTNDLYWSSTSMTRAGNTFTGTIPVAPPGIMHYYFRCTFDGFAAIPTVYPAAGVLSYTNGSTFGSARFQNFAAWATPATFAVYTNNNWVISNGAVQAAAGLLNSVAGGATPYLRTPWLPEGAGNLYLRVRNQQAGSVSYAIQKSYEGTTWTTIASNASTSTTFQDQYATILDRSPCFIRVLKTGGVGASEFLWIDDVTVSYPPADVQITNIRYSPGYPASNETVNVSCSIQSVSTALPAFGITPRVYHRLGSTGAWNTTLMTQAAPNEYTATLPPYPPGTVSYFIRADFGGFYYTKGSVSEKQSPAFSPDAPASATEPTSFWYYDVRRYESDYGYLSVTSNVQTVTMDMIGNDVWQAAIDPRGTNQLIISLAGYGRYTGSGYSPFVDQWGTTNQTRFTLPLPGTTVYGGTNILVQGPFEGLVLVQYDLTANTFVIKQGAFQNFNAWRSSRDYFEESIGTGNITLYTQNFNAMARNSEYTTRAGIDLENFQDIGWTTGHYATATVKFPAGWYVENTTIAQELSGNKAARLSESAGNGRTWPYRATLTEGLKQFDFKLRVSDPTFYPTKYTGTGSSSWNNYRVEATMESERESPMWPYLSMFVKYVDNNNYYEYRVARQDASNVRVSIWKKQGGTLSRLSESGNISASLYDPNVCQLLCVTNNTGRFYLQAYYQGTSRTTAYDASPITGAGSIGFSTIDADISVDDVKVVNMNVQRFENWTAATPGNYSDAGWQIKNGRPTGDYCLLQKGGTVMSPNLGFNIGSLSFQYEDDASGGQPRTTLLGSLNGTSWTSLDLWTDHTNTAWKTWNKTISFSTYRYLMWSNSTVGTDSIRLQDIYVTASTNLYSQDFTAGATSYTPSTPRWYASGGAYKRPGYVGPNLGFDVQLGSTNGSADSGPSVWTTVKSGTYSNMQWATTSVVVKAWDQQFVQIKHTTGQAHLWVDDMSMTSWRATNNSETAGWRLREGWIGFEAANDNRLELERSRANPGIAQSLRTPWMESVGDFTFNYKVANGPAIFDVQAAYAGSPDTFVTTFATITNSSTAWQEYKLTLNTNRAMHIRVNHRSATSGTVLYLDNASITDYKPRNSSMWTAYNSLVTYSQDAREFEPFAVPVESYRTAYLNNSPTSGTKPGTRLDVAKPYIQSPRMPRGVGEVSFWYRSWEDDGSPVGRLYLDGTADSSPETSTNWIRIGMLPSIVNAQYRLFTTNVYEETLRYLRLSSETNGNWARVCVDNVLVGEPIGSSFDVQQFTILPTIPLSSDEVRFEAKLGNFFLNPTNFDVKVYYHVGSNSWGNWTLSDYAPLSWVGTADGVQTYRTPKGLGIPKKAIDTVVQYTLACYFDGAFADKSSPKMNREFTNPAWYYPINLNAGQTYTNPYYVVFSCLPGEVWINELNYGDVWGTGENNEYVEVCGPAGTNIYNWKLKLYDGNLSSYATYRITNITTIASENNGFGFWVLGDTAVSGVDRVFTHPPIIFSQHLSDPGGIRLIRSMGAYEHSVSYGWQGFNLSGFTYAGEKGGGDPDASLYLSGTGATHSAFTWTYNWSSGYLTPNAINRNQTLVRNAVEETIEIRLTGIWVGPTNMWIAFTGTNNMGPTTWYATNLLEASPWRRITNTHETYGSGMYTQWFTLMTNRPSYFYKVIATNAP